MAQGAPVPSCGIALFPSWRKRDDETEREHARVGEESSHALCTNALPRTRCTMHRCFAAPIPAVHHSCITALQTGRDKLRWAPERRLGDSDARTRHSNAGTGNANARTRHSNASGGCPGLVLDCDSAEIPAMLPMATTPGPGCVSGRQAPTPPRLPGARKGLLPLSQSAPSVARGPPSGALDARVRARNAHRRSTRTA